jgi:hypothetical protein
MACEMHSNSSSGVIFGRHKVSHMPANDKHHQVAWDRC